MKTAYSYSKYMYVDGNAREVYILFSFLDKIYVARNSVKFPFVRSCTAHSRYNKFKIKQF